MATTVDWQSHACYERSLVRCQKRDGFSYFLGETRTTQRMGLLATANKLRLKNMIYYYTSQFTKYLPSGRYLLSFHLVSEVQ